VTIKLALVKKQESTLFFFENFEVDLVCEFECKTYKGSLRFIILTR